MKEKISVLMASWNYEQYLPEAIESVINQTYQNWELIIVDDCSTDNSVKVIEKYANLDSRIKFSVNKKNIGLAGTLKRGIEMAEGDWIAFLESDDIFEPNSLSKKAEAIKTGADVIFTSAEIFPDNEQTQEKKTYIEDINKTYLPKSMPVANIQKILPQVNIIPSFSVVMLKKKLLEKCNFNALCKASLDYYLWAQLSIYKFYYINEKLTFWRIHPQSYINTYTHCWFRRYIFYIILFRFTVQDKPLLAQIFLTLNYMRARLIYLKIYKKGFKLNLLNNKFIYEKHFT